MKLNHVLVRTTDLNKMRRFLMDDIGLEQSKRPPFPFPGEWFGAKDAAFVHVIENRQMNASAGAVAHVAIEGANYDALLLRLDDNGVRYYEKDVPLSGERQVFVGGPDGLTVEMLFPMGVVIDRPAPYLAAQTE